MIRILVVTTVRIGYDGLTNHIFSYIKNMDKTDMQVDLVSARGIDEKITPQLQTVGFHRIYRLESRDSNQIKYFLDLKNLIKKNKYHLMHVHGNSATLAVDMLAGVMGGCNVRIAHSHNTSCHHRVLNKLLSPLFLACCTDGFACSEDAGKWLFGSRPFKVIPNGKEIERYLFDPEKRIEMRNALKLQKANIAICHVAAFVPTKNHAFTLELFNELGKRAESFCLFLFGIDGVTLESVQYAIAQSPYRDRIHLMGAKDNIQDYLQAMDIMILPSFYEGFPISLMEGQISGLHCAASDQISREVNITNRIVYLPICDGTMPWVNQLMKWKQEGIKRNTEGNYESFTEAGFNIKQNAEMLREQYLNMVQRGENP